MAHSITTSSKQGSTFLREDSHLRLYLGRFVCNILGDQAYLYLKDEQLEAHIYKLSGDHLPLSHSQIRGGRFGNTATEDLITLVKTVSASFLFASYDGKSLYLFTKTPYEAQAFAIPKPQMLLPPNFFECIERTEVLETLHTSLKENQCVVLIKDPSLPVERVGKTEIANQYLKKYGNSYTHTFWIQASDPWLLQKDLEDISAYLEVPIYNLQDWLENNYSSLFIFDGVNDPSVIQAYLPKNQSHGKVMITSRSSAWDQYIIKVGLLTPQEAASFLLKHAVGEEEDAKKIGQVLGHIPSSLYKAVEKMVIQETPLSNFLSCRSHELKRSAHELKPTDCNLPPQNEDFTGREANLVALEECFSENKPVVLAANAGLGGIGKTQIALQYAYRTFSQYHLIWWIDYSNVDLSYINLAKRLGIYLTDEEKKEEHAIVKKVNTYLELNPGWLLIFDNVENESHIKGFHPNSGGHILITSRNSQWDSTQVKVFKVEVFERQESVQFILKVTGLYDQEAAANNLANTLQDLPLALAQAAAYIKKTSISIEQYIDDFNTWPIDLWGREAIPRDYNSTVKITWSISMKKIQELEKNEKIFPQGGVAVPLMQFCSFLAPNDIPRETLLLEWLEAEYKSHKLDTELCKWQLNESLVLLSEYSMISLTESYVSIHRLVQTVSRYEIPSTQERSMAYKDILRFMSMIFTYTPNQDKLETIKKKLLFISHIEQLALYRHELEADLKIIIKLLKVMYCFIHDEGLDNKFIRGLSELEEVVYSLNEKEREEELADFFTFTAFAFQKLGNFTQAIEYLKKAVERNKKNGQYEKVVTGTYGIGYSYEKLGKLEIAKEHYEKSLETEGGTFSINPSMMAKILNHLGRVSSQLNNPTEALGFLKKALEINRKTLGEEHKEVSINLNNIGFALEKLGKTDEAIKYYQESVEMDKKVFNNPHHPNIAISLCNIGKVYENNGQFQQAKAFYEEALSIQEPTQDDPLGLAYTYDSLGQLLALMNTEEAEENAIKYLEKAAKILRGVYKDKHHENLPKILNRLGTIYEDKGKFTEAKGFYEEALSFMEPTENPEALSSIHNNLGRLFRKMKLPENAMEQLNSALKYAKKIYSDSHPKVTNILENIRLLNQSPNTQ